jgi:hypothetical protein
MARSLMDTDSLVPENLRSNARVIAGGEIAWRGTDIREVLLALRDRQAIILGIESVVFPWAGSGPQVEAIGDNSDDHEIWVTNPDADIVQLAYEKTIQDIERNVPNPYGDDVWYIVVANAGWVED